MKEEMRHFYEKLEERGISRRDFMKYCGFLTATMGLSGSFVPRVAEVFAAPPAASAGHLPAPGRVHRLL